MKKPSRKTQKSKADKLWSEIIRAKGKCEICGRSDGVLHPHHIIGRKNLNLRWDLRNGCCLCYQHHIGGKESAHNDPLWFQDWMMKHRREDLNYLFIKRMELATSIDYGDIIKSLEKDRADCVGGVGSVPTSISPTKNRRVKS